MESKWNTTFCRLRGRVGVKRGRGRGVEASNVINDPKCNKGPKCNNFSP